MDDSSFEEVEDGPVEDNNDSFEEVEGNAVEYNDDSSEEREHDSFEEVEDDAVVDDFSEEVLASDDSDVDNLVETVVSTDVEAVCVTKVESVGDLLASDIVQELPTWKSSNLHIAWAPFILEKVNWPDFSIVIQATGRPLRVPQVFTLSLSKGLREPPTTLLISEPMCKHEPRVSNQLCELGSYQSSCFP